MNYTTNFNLNKPEGTDLYNHLTVDNPNMDTIDAAMQANKLASVGAATELVSGTVHAITRSDSDQNIFKFKATGDFKAGDTITVDGVSVNAYTTDGQQLLNDAYVLSAEVLCILDSTSLWVLVNKTPDASEVDYDNSNTGLAASNVQDAIDAEFNNLSITNANVITITPRSLSYNIDTTSQLDALAVQTTFYAYVGGAASPWGYNNWATIQTVGSSVVKNQTFISANGIAFRHYENNIWGAWKKTIFS